MRGRGRATAERWATFDCYGTLVDWNGGIARALEELFGAEPAPRMLERYHELEPQVEAEVYRPYREVLARTLERAAKAEGLPVPQGAGGALADSLPGWPSFPEVPGALEELRRLGWRLAILSNCDRDLIAASEARIGVPFDLTVVAEDVGSYKPAHAHWRRFFGESGAEPRRHVHVAASLFHDIAPAAELGLASVWVNRLGEAADPRPDREIADLGSLSAVLDELVAP